MSAVEGAARRTPGARRSPGLHALEVVARPPQLGTQRGQFGRHAKLPHLYTAAAAAAADADALAADVLLLLLRLYTL